MPEGPEQTVLVCHSGVGVGVWKLPKGPPSSLSLRPPCTSLPSFLFLFYIFFFEPVSYWDFELAGQPHWPGIPMSLCFLTAGFISVSAACSFFQTCVLAIKVGSPFFSDKCTWVISPGHICFYRNGCVVELQVLYIWGHQSMIECMLCQYFLVFRVAFDFGDCFLCWLETLWDYCMTMLT